MKLVAAAIFLPPVELKAKIKAVLIRQLSPQDLSRSKAGLIHKLRAIGNASGLFTFPLDGEPGRDGILRRVSGATREWTVIVNIQDDDMVPSAGFWLGARGPKVASAVLPQEPNSLEGPLDGEWRRVGNRLLGAGVSVAFHSPTFIDGVYLVFAAGPRGITLLQNGRLDLTERPPAFRSPTSNDLICRTKKWRLNTLVGGRYVYVTQERLLRLLGGRYRTIRFREIHDKIWAFDQFATAVRLHRWAELREMAPDSRTRRLAARRLRER